MSLRAVPLSLVAYNVSGDYLVLQTVLKAWKSETRGFVWYIVIVGFPLKGCALIRKVQRLSTIYLVLWSLLILPMGIFVDYVLHTLYGITAGAAQLKIHRIGGIVESLAVQLIEIIATGILILITKLWLSWLDFCVMGGQLALKYLQVNGELIEQQQDFHYRKCQNILLFSSCSFICFNLEDKVGLKGNAMLHAQLGQIYSYGIGCICANWCINNYGIRPI